MKNTLIAISLIVFVITMRLLPHPANFAPVAAAALFAAVYLNRRAALAVPLFAMLLSDLIIGFYDWRLMVAVYVGLTAVSFIGYLVRRQKNVLNIITGALGGSLLFFTITNFAVWLFSSYYAKTWEGLLTAYTLAIPFFRNTLMGDLFYVAVFFGVYAGARQLAAMTPRSVTADSLTL